MKEAVKKGFKFVDKTYDALAVIGIRMFGVAVFVVMCMIVIHKIEGVLPWVKK